MVLKFLPLCLLVALVGCAGNRPLVKAPVGAHRAWVAIVAEKAGSETLTKVPDAVHDMLVAALAKRGLEVTEPAPAALSAAFAQRRRTEVRLEYLASTAKDADVVVLVEAVPRYYSQMSGQLRWTVDSRVTVARKDAIDRAVHDDTHTAVFLNYVHEDGEDALMRAASAMARQLGATVDDFLAGITAPAAPAAAPTSPAQPADAAAQDPASPTAESPAP